MGPLAEYAVHHPVLVAGLVFMAAAVAAFELRNRTGGGYSVAATDAVRLMNKGAMVIDLRSAEAFQTGHIVNARNIAIDSLMTERSVIKKQKNKVMIAVCDTGTNSSRAAGMLRKAGFENAFSLKGGLKAWREENLPLVK